MDESRFMYTKILTVLMLVVVAVACSPSANDLSRKEVKGILQEAATLEPASITLLPGRKAGEGRELIKKCYFNSLGQLGDEKAILLDWQRKGFITIVTASKSVAPVFGGTTSWEICLLTDKGKNEILLSSETIKHYTGNYESIQIKVAERNILDVTGIKKDESGTNAIAYFRYNVKRNSAGDSLPADSDLGDYYQDLLSSGTHEGSAQLALYDDGWRLEKIDFGKLIAASSSSINTDSNSPRSNAGSSPTESTSASAEETKKDTDYEPLVRKYSGMSVATMADNPDALQLGERLFSSYCTSCHGSNARGAFGVPNLRDNDWQYGVVQGQNSNQTMLETIYDTIYYGRSGVMPAWMDALGGDAGVSDVAEYVLSLSGRNVDTEAAARGKEKFDMLCVACHGTDGTGFKGVGGPNLTDNIWLYGGSRSTVIESIAKGRDNSMPPIWDVLDPSYDQRKEKFEVKLLDTYANLLAAYVDSLSIGEVVELNPSQQGIVRDLLEAYDYNLETINLVANNADYAVLAWAAYGDSDALDLAKQRGWTPMRTIAYDHLLTGDTVARLFTHDDGKAVLAFRGTTKSIGDWVTNILGTLQNNPLLDNQVEDAEKIAREIVSEYPDIIFTGHSLGGRLAQIGRLTTGNEAVIFNSAPLGASEIGELISAIINKPNGSLIGFRGPQDPLGDIDPASGFRDVIVENIYRAGDVPNLGIISEASEAFVRIKEQSDYFHGSEVLASAMQIVRNARDEGWIDAYK